MSATPELPNVNATENRKAGDGYDVSIQVIPPMNLLTASLHQRKLFDLAYGATFQAADKLSDAYSTEKITLPQAREILVQLAAATAAWQTFTDLLNGQPEPARG